MKKKGLSDREVAERVGAAHGSVHRWWVAYREGGDTALDSKPHPGPKPQLDERRLKRLAKILAKGATSRGYPTELWTLARVAEVIEEEFDVVHRPGHVWRILIKMGWSCQKPERLARERDEDAIREWREMRWPHIKKRPRRRS